MAISEVTSVPKMYGRAPNCLWTGSHFCVTRNFAPKRAIASRDSQVRSIANPTTMSNIRRAASIARTVSFLISFSYTSMIVEMNVKEDFVSPSLDDTITSRAVR